MNHPKFTPGPWHVYGYRDGLYCVRSVEFAEKEDDEEVDSDEPVEEDEDEANVRLIEAAPELLAALQSMIQWAKLTVPVDKLPPHLKEWETLISSIIE